MSPCWPCVNGFAGSRRLQNMSEMEGRVLTENRQNLEWRFPFWSPRCALSSLPYHWLCGFRFVQFIETNHSHFPWKQLLYFHSCSSSSLVGRRPQPVTTSTHAITESYSGNQCVFVSFNPIYWVWLDIFSSLEYLFTNECYSVPCFSSVCLHRLSKSSKVPCGQVGNGQKFS